MQNIQPVRILSNCSICHQGTTVEVTVVPLIDQGAPTNGLCIIRRGLSWLLSWASKKVRMKGRRPYGKLKENDNDNRKVGTKAKRMCVSQMRLTPHCELMHSNAVDKAASTAPEIFLKK